MQMNLRILFSPEKIQGLFFVFIFFFSIFITIPEETDPVSPASELRDKEQALCTVSSEVWTDSGLPTSHRTWTAPRPRAAGRLGDGRKCNLQPFQLRQMLEGLWVQSFYLIKVQISRQV